MISVRDAAPKATTDPATNPCCDPDDATWCLECAHSDPATWPEWTDQDRWVADDPEPEGDDDHLWNILESYEPTEAERRESAEMFGAMDAQRHLDHGATLTLAELADRQADFYRGWANPCGEMFARAMDALAMQIRLTSASTPAELEARVDALEDDARDTWRAVGFEEGRRASSVDAYA